MTPKFQIDIKFLIIENINYIVYFNLKNIIAIINKDKCKPNKCGLKCKKICHPNQNDLDCIKVNQSSLMAEIVECICK